MSGSDSNAPQVVVIDGTAVREIAPNEGGYSYLKEEAPDSSFFLPFIIAGVLLLLVSCVLFGLLKLI